VVKIGDIAFTLGVNKELFRWLVRYLQRKREHSRRPISKQDWIIG
jgi:hypothetical protein